MDEWSEQFWRNLNAIADDTEHWLEQVTHHLSEASKAFLYATDEWMDDLQNRVDPEVNRIVDEINQTVEPLEAAVDAQVEETAERINQVLDPVVDAIVMGLGEWVETIAAPVHNTVEPIVRSQPACVGCRHYYGQAHGGNMLVCAMHPYGPDAEECPDYESFWPNQTNLD